jgi:hypothetical protein
MTMIHQCSQCGHQGRVVELADRYLCESCDEQHLSAQRADEQCVECGSQGVTSTGICYACENSSQSIAPVAVEATLNG